MTKIKSKKDNQPHTNKNIYLQIVILSPELHLYKLIIKKLKSNQILNLMITSPKFINILHRNNKVLHVTLNKTVI
jgi:hypothetical protein